MLYRRVHAEPEFRQVLLENFRWVSEDKFVNRRISYDIAGEENTVVFDGMMTFRPFRVIECKQIFAGKNKGFDNGGDDSLLNMKTYTLTSASDTVRPYRYIFTRLFSATGKPIE